ncbi:MULTISPECIES: type VI secretion system accessory protein TagJ [unclassified Agarivorans]|uniref:type VI secretion system accessory protein TagJ n=1 Tax=unclassified Agarivorans TaxID=2636026 RepID=UPI0026E39C9A|nr:MULTISPECIES: type VI secretion system accessory protein TagJ [unclassified Agarivorans]MDO6685498.1 type VI secretion system accessory protein TagJ [Agarivorans sp. 3_MG-2023]MDO6715884.1 type VI secretion system accessory protein TagJ [Agarivorans sp. 2_MG-2023]
MQQQIKQLIQVGQLSEAIAATIAHLKVKPKDLEARSSFIELLCIDGQLERADQQLDLLVKQHPECVPGALNMRQIVHAAQSRVDFANGGDTATLTSGAKQSLTPLVELRLALLNQDKPELERTAQQLEALRENAPLDINEKSCDELRDIDDSLAGYLEAFGSNGLYYLVPFSEVTWLKLLPANNLFEHIWRRAEIDIKDGPTGEVFIPMTYLASETDAEKLGRETDWQPLLDSEFYQGRGQKLWLVNDGALTLSQLESFTETKQVETAE